MTATNATKPVIGLANPVVPIQQASITHSTRVPNSATEYAPIRSFKKLDVDELVGVDSADPRNRTLLSLGGVVGTFRKSDYIGPQEVVPPTALARGDSDPMGGDDALDDRAVEPTLITKIHAGQTSMHVDIDPATRQAIQGLLDVIPGTILSASQQLYFTAGGEEVLLTPVHPVFREYEIRRIRAERRQDDKRMPPMGLLPAGGTNSHNCGVFNSVNRGIQYFCFRGYSAAAEFSLGTLLSRLAKGQSSGASLIDGLLQQSPLPGRTLRHLRHLASEPDTRVNHERIDTAASQINTHLQDALTAPFATLRWMISENPEIAEHDLLYALPKGLRETLLAPDVTQAGRAELSAAALAHVVARIERAGLARDAKDIPALPSTIKARIAASIKIRLEA